MPVKQTLSASLEDYIEAIYHLAKSQQVARVTDIAMKLEVQKASVTGALQALVNKGLIHYSPYSFITLTDDGMKVARNIVKRHKTLCRFFSDVLGIDKKTAEENACRIEHDISSEVLGKLIKLTKLMKICPRMQKAIAELGSKTIKNCEECLALSETD